jgi:RND family efflux transporter MFP subunit
VRVVEVEPADLQLSVLTQGTVKPRSESDLVPEVSGPVLWVSPALVSGGSFEEGDPLLRIDPTDYEVAVEQARASRERARSEEKRARKDYERRRGLAERNYASAAQLDDAENGKRVAQAALREAKASLVKAERDLERTEIRAPYSGRVREENVDVGQFVNRGSPIAKIYAVDFAEVRLPVPDHELAFVRLYDPKLSEEGPRVRLRARFAGGDHEWEGRVVRTEGEIDPHSRMVHVVARVDDPYGRHANGSRPPLVVGLFVEAEILGEVAPGAVVLPRSALLDDDRVLVVGPDNRLRYRTVEVLRRSGDEVVIKSGLEAHEHVCVSALQSVVDGMEVRIADVAGRQPAVAAGLPPPRTAEPEESAP